MPRGGSHSISQRSGYPEVRLMWLTFAPPLANASAFSSTEWEATFTNWTLTGPEEKRTLQVAGPRSVAGRRHRSVVHFTGDVECRAGILLGGIRATKLTRR